MAGSSQKDRNKVDVSVQHECPLNLLPREIWSSIATMIASNSIEDLFNMKATCKVFLGVASSDPVYKHATMSYKPLARFLLHLDGPERRFLDRCVEVGNVDAILRHGFTEYLWFGHCIGGMDTLTMAATGGDLEACYMCEMLLLSHTKEDEEHLRKGLEFFEIVRDSGALKRCREVFRQVFAGPWVEVNSLDPGLPEVCRSTSCRTRGTMGDVEESSRVSCVQCLADYEVRVFRELFAFE
ncbi:hypothetical protein Ahy_B09g096194 isoform C [Arachis hypogaea]|uniref:At2g35280-like TPR domain-containing protein n=1 Tax=Arachis hypogaea TaxID=3818 RepID=A0A444XJ23_ARAHY|nr:hypothetical protein Ahy_B09g096194 isoform C [Arachis hypogaea]